MSTDTPDLTAGLPAALLELARRAAAAGAAVLAGRNAAELDISNKGDSGDWVTAFDLAAETAVRDVITAARPFDIITGEEGGTVLPIRHCLSGKVGDRLEAGG